MAVPAVPKLTDLPAEFGGPGNLRAYNRGGSFVPDIPANSAVSTNPGNLRLSTFAGAVNETLTLSGAIIIDSVATGTATAIIHIISDGTTDQTVGPTRSQINSSTDWIIPNNAAPGSYRVRATLTSGTTPTSGPALNTFHVLTTTRSWRNDRSINGSTSSTLLIEIDDGSGIVIASGSYSINATVSSG